jgi:nitrite reductase/ring-hydroxylating ferredoxin subunit
MEQFDISPYPAGWFFVAFSDEIAPKSVHPLRYLGEDLVCYRGETGAAHVMHAYCPHQGAHLGYGGRVLEDDIVCPFHSWRFAPDGSNVAIPYAEGRDCDALLPPWEVREIDGMILVWYHPDGRAPDWEPQPVPEFGDPSYPTPWRSAPFDVKVHPQDVFENAVDAAHFVSVHGGYRHPRVEITLSEGPHFIATLLDQKLRSARGGFDATVSSDLWGLGLDVARMEASFMTMVYMLLQTPVDEESVRIWFNITAKRNDRELTPEETPAFLEHAGTNVISEFKKDALIWERKVYRAAPRLADNETSVVEFRRWAQQFYPAQVAV